MKSLYLFIVTIFAIISISGYSQTITQTDALLALSEREANAYIIRKAQAVEWAVANGYPVTVRIGDAMMEIQFLDENGRPQYYTTDNVNAAATISTNKVYPGGGAGLSLTGTGITVREWDSGSALSTHQEFNGRVTVGDGASSASHSTHVAGTIMASGVAAGAKGMAYQASLRSFDWNSDASEMATEGAAGALISNHSYGFVRGWYWTGTVWAWNGTPSISTLEDYLFGFYDSYAQLWDQIAQNAPYYLICKSAGNDRGNTGIGYPADGPYDCIEQKGISKNVLTVGAVEDISGGYTTPSSVVMTSFSSWGPADDGRIKPDIVTNGAGLYSSNNVSNTSYTSMSGTSMATPSAVGSLALLQQHHFNLQASYMRSATLKALVIHTADEAGTTTGPDYQFGWGLMNTRKAAVLLSEDQANDVISEQVLINGSTYTRDVVAMGTQPFKVTVVWTDPPGTPQAASLDPITPMLVNDLDLRISQSASTWYPWKLDRDNPANAATNIAENNVDNVEVVYIASPVAGATYTITVDHDGTLSGGSQAFSLIVSGIVSNVIPDANFEANNTSPGINGQVIFTDLSLSGPTSWSWTFSPATVTYLNGTTSASQNPQVQFTATGLYTVTLTAANAIGNNAEVKTNYINVISCNFISFPITESFEGSYFPPSCWTTTILTGTGNWARTMIASGSGVGSASVIADFYNQSSGWSYELKSMPFDASSLSAPTLRFKYAYATYSVEVDQMDVYYSTNSGSAYTLLLAMPGGAAGILNTGGTTTSSFIPTAAQWGTQTLTLPAGTNMVKFKATSKYGNCLYLDDVTVFDSNTKDASTQSIDISAIHALGSFTPQATVSNNGSNVETFPVTMTIGTYTSTKTVSTLSAGSTRQVTFDNWTPTAATYSVQVCTQLTGDVVNANDCLLKDVKIVDLSKKVYAYLTSKGSGTDPLGPTSFTMSTPGTLNSIIDQSALLNVTGATWAGGKWFGVVNNASAPFEFVTVNTVTGIRTVIGPATVNMSALSYNITNNTMYGIAVSGANSNLYSINITTGENTFIGSCGAFNLNNLAINSAGKAYSVDIVTDVLGTVNLATGAFTPVGSVGFDAINAQDLEFDRETGELYIAAFSTSGWLGWVNQTSGAVTKIADFEGSASVSGLAIPYSIGYNEKALSAGWTWFSLNVTNPDMSLATVLGNLKPTEGDYIKNQIVSAQYFDSYGWFGELAQFDPREMYKIKLAKADVLKLSGTPVEPAAYPITLVKGWNWIGYIPQLAKPITESLSSMAPVPDDYIKNQTKSNTFFEGYGWFGELNDLQPIDGYMLKTSHSGILSSEEKSSGTFTDPRDSKAYPWVKVGTQTWMAENLAYLPAVSFSADGSFTDPYYYVYGYEGTTVSVAKATSNFTTYGALYNWNAALTACPSGWHLPTDAEWTTLTTFLTNNSYGYAGSGVDIAKSMASTSLWTSGATAGTVGNNQASNNTTGLAVRPGGYRFKDGYFYDLAGYAYMWTATVTDPTFAGLTRLYYASDAVYQGTYPRGSGFSVRCLKD